MPEIGYTPTQEAQDHRGISTPLLYTLAIAGGIVLSQFAFSRKTRREILERDHFQCTESGLEENLHASHFDHNRNNPDYDSPRNGRTLNIIEHLRDHIARAGKNGLTQSQNDWAIEKLMDRIDDLYG